MPALRVATFNVRNGRAFDGLDSWPFRRQRLAQSIKALDADLLGLQEVFAFQQRFLHKSLGSYDFYGASRTGRSWGERCPVLVRRGAFRVLQQRTLWYGDKVGGRLPGSSFARTATICTLQMHDHGEPVQFANTHLDERSDTNRRISVAQLLEWLNPELATIVVGDLNATPISDLFDQFAEAGFRQALPHDAPGTVHGFSGLLEGPRIDHILVSPHFDISSAEIARPSSGRSSSGRPPSDHWPVVAGMRLRSG